jgi:hypothetical protein
MARHRGPVLVDTNVILECWRINAWRALAGGYREETVEDCVIETQTGYQRRRPEQQIDREAPSPPVANPLRSHPGSAPSVGRGGRPGSCLRHRADSGDRGCRAAPRCSRSRRRRAARPARRAAPAARIRDQPQRLATGINDFDGANENAPERIAAHRIKTGGVGERAHLLRQAIPVERIARHWSDQIGAAPH